MAEQTVTTKPGARTCSLDTKNNVIVVICTERAPQPATTDTNAPPATGRRGGRGGFGGPGYLDVVFIGR